MAQFDSNGLRQLDHLQDKTTLFIYKLEEEWSSLYELKKEAMKLRAQNETVRNSHRNLTLKIKTLEEKQIELDQKASELLRAIDESMIF
ncbi:MAG: hypothetical protein R2684_04700 [Pyrinomonadaceae bacterium]